MALNFCFTVTVSISIYNKLFKGSVSPVVFDNPAVTSDVRVQSVSPIPNFQTQIF